MSDFCLSALMLSAGEQSFWSELWTAIEERYFSVNVGNYQNIDINRNSFLSLQIIVLGIFLGIVISTVFVVYDKRKLGGFVRQVISEGCLSPEKAKTLDELGYLKDPAVRGNLKRGGVLSRAVKCVERDKFLEDVEFMREKYIEKNGSDKGFREPEFRIDLENAHFYIPDEEHYRAELRFDQKGTGWRSILLVILISVVGAVLVCFLLPEMLQLVDNMIGIFNGQNNGIVT
ncbi:MAG: hypothetical protein E7589_06145 [Ruminococcaceae bacterium]|nr:hypothetical protein [Oscillospiraceae bacterium]